MTTRALLVVSLGLVACEATSRRYAALDAPPPAPVPVGDARPLTELTKVTELSEAEKAKAAKEKPACGRGSGRDIHGECVPLGLWDTDHVQRVQIPGGVFVMGNVPEHFNTSPSRELPAVRWSGNPPRHEMARSFWIDLHEVTRGAYAACVAAGGCTPGQCPEGQVDPGRDVEPQIADSLPQTCVSHKQAEDYCRHAGGRMPSEAEWEYAARGPDARVWPWGNQIKDDIPQGLYPAGHVREDSSYFGLRGMGSNAIEWTADVYEGDAALKPFVAEAFRAADGPLAVARAVFEQAAFCGDKPDCEAPKGEPLRHVYKYGNVGQRRGARESRPPRFPGVELEGWDVVGADHRLGFRCAADLRDADKPLQVPAAVAPIPIVRSEGALELFGGVVEAVNQEEARRFCAGLRVPYGAEALTGFRLPRLAEVEQLAAVFRGPGPFWAEDGAAVQMAETTPPDPNEPWKMLMVGSETALAARCVRDVQQ
ncbi:formylglycine-generating enzyme family protein [Nannocystis radixulma]|uniref:SUMF1/EgtB/PvdO family nonheme iron enzyme n=1 Tax=Nannocystis radixulma TaxID=2995305 RepID=A0ABT5BNU2_9BACT|nr:SUMF1/EgtB/PvdO family nonheme iron enzyme [Nannocystis radixulma]MDC0675836.1 SUMF1/EgtB/PvdO family nonheme iron enzyme [Nannocystis radixulma]